MKKNIFIVSIFILFSFSFGFAQSQKNQAQSKDQKNTYQNNPNIILFKDTVINGRDIISKCEEMKQEILQSNKILDSGRLSIIAMWFEEYSNHPKIEEETNISREWFKKLSQEVSKLQYIAYKFECAKEEPEVQVHDQIIKKAPEKYKEILKTFNDIADKPIKIKSEKKKK